MAWEGLAKRVREAQQRSGGPVKEVTTAFGRKGIREVGPLSGDELVGHFVDVGLTKSAAESYAGGLSRGKFLSFEDAVSDYITKTPRVKVDLVKVREAAGRIEGRVLREGGAR